MKRVFSVTLAAVLLIALPACKKKQNDEFAGIDGDFVSGTPLADRIDGANFFGSNVQRGQFSPVYFDYDSYSVPGAEQSKIEQVASSVRSSGNTVIVAGFTDERGTEEYNRGLGERRAIAVREALIAAGVSAAKVQTVSFGEDMPADPGSGDSAWALNRRAEFGVVK